VHSQIVGKSGHCKVVKVVKLVFDLTVDQSTKSKELELFKEFEKLFDTDKGGYWSGSPAEED